MVHILRGIDVDVADGQWTSIMGPSGSGKSTLLHCIAGLVKPDSGSIFLDDGQGSAIDIAALGEDSRARLRRNRIAVIFQDFNLIPVLSVKDNLQLPAKLARQRRDRDWEDKVISLLGLTNRMNHLPGELSGGQQQRVAIARALFTRSDVIVADEPTGSLDTQNSQAVLKLFKQVVDQFGRTVLMVTHDSQAAEWSDRVVHMKDGLLTGNGAQ